MKHRDIPDTNYTLSNQQYENIFNVYEDEDIGYFYNLLRTVNFPDDLDSAVYDLYIIEPRDTWPLISWRNYNSVMLWWVICAMNNIQNPLAPLEVGRRLKILKTIYLKNILNSITTE